MRLFRYFASGSLQRHMSCIYRISKQHFGTILDTVCDAIINTFKEEIPNWDKARLVAIANDYNQKWNLPNCMGSTDGKHFAINRPANSGSLFYNYKVSINIRYYQTHTFK